MYSIYYTLYRVFKKNETHINAELIMIQLYQRLYELLSRDSLEVRCPYRNEAKAKTFTPRSS